MAKGKIVMQQWVNKLILKRLSGSAHAFLVSGNTGDYVGYEESAKPDDCPIFMKINQILEQIFSSHAFVFHYRPGPGLTFASEEHQRRFVKYLEAREAEQKKVTGQNPVPAVKEQPPKHLIQTDANKMVDLDLGEEEDDPKLEQAIADARMIKKFPPDIRDLYKKLPEEIKGKVRNFHSDAARLDYLLERQKKMKVYLDAQETAQAAGEIDPETLLPQNPAQVWRFLCQMMGIKMEDLKKLIPDDLPKAKKRLPKSPVAVIVHSPELFVQGGFNTHLSDLEQVVLGNLLYMAETKSFGEEGNVLVLVSSDATKLPDVLTKPTSCFAALEATYPTEIERNQFLHALPAWLGQVMPTGTDSETPIEEQEILTFAPEQTPNELCLGPTAGLRRIDIEDVGRGALIVSSPLTSDACWERKKIYLEDASQKQIKVIRPSAQGSWIGGHDKIKQYLAQVAEAIRNGHINRVPKGLLFTGPWGTGKSTLGDFLAMLSSFSFVKIENEFDPYLGMSARNHSRNRALIMAMSPVVVFEDELESKHLPRGSMFHGDGGVGARVDAMEREFLADDSRRGKILWIGATNRPDQLEEALIRPGRFDRIIPVLPPRTPQAWAVVFEAVARKMVATSTDGSFKWEVPNEALLEICDKELPAEIAQGHANEFCYRALHLSANGVIGPLELRAGIRDYRPRKTPEFTKQVELAIQYANSFELIPEEYQTTGIPVVEKKPKAVMTAETKFYSDEEKTQHVGTLVSSSENPTDDDDPDGKSGTGGVN